MAVQVTVVVPMGNVDPEAGAHTGVSVPGGQLSVAVAVKVTLSPAIIVVLVTVMLMLGVVSGTGIKLIDSLSTSPDVAQLKEDVIPQAIV